MKTRLFIGLCILALAASIFFKVVPFGTITKGLMGKQDVSSWLGTTSDKTFTRATSTGYDMTLNKFDWMGVDVLVAYGNNTNRTLATLSSALTGVGITNKVAFWLSPGTWTITDDLTITSNVTLICPPGVSLSITAAKTLTVSGFVNAAASYQIFSGTGAVALNQPAPAEWFGVATSATAANNDTYIAQAFAASSHVTLLTPGTYNFDTIVIPTEQIFEIGKKVIINKSTSSTSTYALNVSGTIGTDTTTLSVDATMGANSITVTDATDFPAGTFFYLEDDEWDGTANTYKHEINVVDAVAGAVLKLKYPICNYYKTANTATITKIDTIKENIHIFGEGKITTSLATASYGIYVEYGARVKITGLEIRGFYNHHVSVRYSVDCLVENNDIGDGIAFASGQGYGISLTSGSSHNSVLNNRLRKLRHCLVAGGGSTFNLWSNNHLHGYHTNALDGIDLHGSYIHHDRYTDNYIAGMKQDGIAGSDPFNEFSGNIIVGCERFGISLTKYIHDGISGIASACVVSNNTIRHYASNRAINITSYNSDDATDTTILDNLIIQNNNISLHAAAGQTNVCGIYARGISGLITGNKIRYETPAQTDTSSNGLDIQEWNSGANYGLIKRTKVSGNFVYGGYHGIILKGDTDAIEISDNRFEQQYTTGISILGRTAGNELEGTVIKNNHIIQSGNLTNGIVTNECNHTSIIGNEFFIGGTLTYMIRETSNTEDTTILNNKAYGTVTTPFTFTDMQNVICQEVIVKFGTVGAVTDDDRPLFLAEGQNGNQIIDILLINAADITQHDTDYETFTVIDKGAVGTANNTVTTCTTKATGGKDFNAFDALSISTCDATHGLLARDEVLSFSKVHANIGQGTDEMVVIVRYVTY